jgi:hypothetical protein
MPISFAWEANSFFGMNNKKIVLKFHATMRNFFAAAAKGHHSMQKKSEICKTQFVAKHVLLSAKRSCFIYF